MAKKQRTSVTYTTDQKNMIIDRYGPHAAVAGIIGTEWLSYVEIAKHGVNLTIDTFTLQDIEDIRMGFHNDIPLHAAIRLVLNGKFAAVIDPTLIPDRKRSLAPTVSELSTLHLLGLIDCMYLICSEDKQSSKSLLAKFTDENTLGLCEDDPDDC